MKTCPNCNTYLDDAAAVCSTCGFQFNPGPQQPMPPYNQQQQQQQVPFTPDPTDHTAEFSAQDISDNKVIAMIVYLASYIGILLAVIISKESPFVGFHVRQALKIMVTEILLGLAAAILSWTILVPVAALVCICILEVIKIIAFFQVCKGQAKEPAIIKGLSFLK